MITRRNTLKLLGAAAATSVIPLAACGGNDKKAGHQFRFCLNTSTIRGQQPGLTGAVEIAAEAGYDSVELWVDEIRDYIEKGHSLNELKRILDLNGISVDGAIGFAPWIVDDEEQRKAGFARMEEEMNIMAELGCTRIAAPPAGYSNRSGLDYDAAARRYARLLELGRKTGVVPHLEFWGSSQSLNTLGQALLVAAGADDPDARILIDVYQIFRGNSGFGGLSLVRGEAIEMVHMNDYPGDVPREQQTDAHRLYPGDGVGPVREMVAELHRMGGVKILALELFNRTYWEQDALQVARTGLRKMKDLVESVL